MGAVITVHQAEQLDYLLREGGRPWEPAPGDRFVIPGRDIDEVFVVSTMVVEVTELPSGRLMQFNGTTEWALDSIPVGEVLWIPWEHQLRGLLGGWFASLTTDGERFTVTLVDGSEHVGDDPDSAYISALLWPA